MTKYYWLAALLILTLSSCSQGGKRYTIGVSQCSEDIWREKQNAELRMGAYFHDNVELKFAAAYDSDERQVQQIDSLMNEGIDLLIVAPNQVNTISPAIDRAYDKGIPVIVFERKTGSQKYCKVTGPRKRLARFPNSGWQPMRECLSTWCSVLTTARPWVPVRH